MSTPHEKELNRRKQKRFQEKHKGRLRYEYQQRALRESAWKPPAAGRRSIDVINGEPVITASGGLVGGLTGSAAKRICAGLKKLLGTKPEPKPGSPVWLITKDGKVRKFISLTQAGAALGVHRSTIQRKMLGGGDCASCGGWTDRADFAEYAGSQVGLGDSDCTILRGCHCGSFT